MLEPTTPSRPHRALCRATLLAGVSAAALLTIGLPAQARNILGGGGSGAAAVASAAALAGAQQAAQMSAQAQNSLLRASQTIQAMRAAQNAARNLNVNAPSNVPSGLVIGGLVPDSGLAAPGTASPVATWVGANTPTQTTSSGQTTVTINQTAPQALLNWQSFNLSKTTTVNFNQQGNASWIALNQIAATGVPSQILGNIRADGQVYLINRNGVIFGGSSQINVQTLVAAALPINAVLFNTGTLYSNLDFQFTFSSYGQPGGPATPTAASTTDAATAASQNSAVTVEAGAVIATPTTSNHNGGRVILIGPTVVNNGSILTPDGQTILAAGQQVALLPHASSDPSLRGLDVYIGSVQAPTIGIQNPLLSVPTHISTVMTGTATNNGLIEADRGNITIAGATVNQMGALLSTTSASLNGRIDLSANYNASNVVPGSQTGATTSFYYGLTGIVTAGPGSVAQILPELASAETVVGTSLALPSQVNVTGLAFYLGRDGQIIAPNGNVAVNVGTWKRVGLSGQVAFTDGQIYIDSGASIDVSGSIRVPVPVSQNVVAVELRGAQLANSPLQRAGALRGRTVFVDIRQTGANPDGTTWIGTPLADASGYANLIQRTVGELTTNGGSITLNAGKSVVLQQGSTLNVSGGWIDFQAGLVNTSRLIGADGHLYGFSQATPDRAYVGLVTDGFTVVHSRWGVRETYMSPLLAGGYYDPGYIQGGNGGSIAIQAPAVALDGELFGLTVAGPRQRQILPASGAFSLTLSGTGSTTPDVVVQAGQMSTAAPFSPGSYGLDPTASVYLSPALTGVNGIGSLNIATANGNIEILSDLAAPAHGSIALTGKNITVEANLTVPGGSVNLTTKNHDPSQPTAIPLVVGRGAITVGSGASVNVAGLVIDDTTGSAAASSSPLVVNGGSVFVNGFSVALASGSVIDASGGIAIASNGKLTNGSGGSISLATDFALTSTNDPVYGALVLGATLKGYGVGTTGRGGSLTLQAPALQVGGTAVGAGAPNSTLLLPEDFFNQGGFASFSLAGRAGVRIAANAAIRPVIQSYQPLRSPGGSGAIFAPISLPAVLRNPASLSLAANNVQDSSGGIVVRGDVVMAAGASINLDATSLGAGSIAITGDTAAILGSIIVPGGSISVVTHPANADSSVTADLASTSLLSTAGTAVPSFDARGNPQGLVLKGGSISVSGNILAEANAVLDVSGASGMINVPSIGLSLRRGTVARRADSDGGSLTLTGKYTLFTAATLRGDRGGPTALGGSLQVTYDPHFGSSLQVTQSLPTAVAYRAGLAAIGSDVAVAGAAAGNSFAVDSFGNGHFDALTLGEQVSFSGPVQITAARRITVATGGSLTADAGVALSAPYVAIGSPGMVPVSSTQGPAGGTPPTAGSGSLTVTAGDLIDVGSLTLLTIGATSLTSANDIRGYGTFEASGQITMTAAQVYPTTGASFTMAAFDSPVGTGSITFNAANGTRALPLSAGGQINVFGTTINQNGVLRAPLGTINLGSIAQTSGSGFNNTTTLTLGTGSTTSVSAIDPVTGRAVIIPYGTMLNGSVWIDPFGNDISTGGVPAKVINLAGMNVAIAPKATVDIRGGGDLYAYNWVKGLGGGNDILAASTSFAVIPGYHADYAPLLSITKQNPDGSTVAESGWSNGNLSVGDQITLAASTNGLAAGTYALMPARYALLPGAFLVTPVKGTPIGTLRVANPDGSSVVSGSRFNDLNAGRVLAAQPTLFEVDSAGVVNARAQYDSFFASTTLAQSALAHGVAVPRLPVDAGTLNLFATQTMIIQGAVQARAAPGGLGGFVNIASPNKIVITDTGAGTAPNTLHLNSTGLSAFGADSLLIGGTRTDSSAGTIVNITTNSIEVANDTAGILYGPEIILASTGSLTLDPGAVVQQLGTLSSAAETLLIGNASNANSGNGALLRVSSDISAQIVRAGVTPGGSARLAVGSGAQISGNSVILDTTGTGSFDPAARLSGAAVALGSGQISLVLNNPGTLNPNPGLVLPQTVLSTLQSTVGALSLLSYTSTDIYGSGAIGAVDASGQPTVATFTLHTAGIRGFNNGGGIVAINAQNIAIDNSQNGTAVVAAPGVNNNIGTLIFRSGTLDIGTNALNVIGYADVHLDAANGILVQGAGGFATAGNLTATTALIAGAAGASQSITAGGALTVNPVAGNPAATVAGGIGATLTLAGTSVAENSRIVLPSGSLTLHASGTSGGSDVVVGGTLDVSGTAQVFFDQVRFTNGGQIALTADTGSVNLAGGALYLDALRAGSGALPVAGDAGTLSISAPSGSFTNGATLSALGGASGKNGSFALDVGSLSSALSIAVNTTNFNTGAVTGTTTVTGNSLASLDAALNAAGFTRARTMRVRSGNVIIDGTANAASYAVSADSGAIAVTGTINAGGLTGGQIGLYGYNGVTLANGALLTVAAQQFDAAGRGGLVDIETGEAKAINGVMTSGVGWIDIQGGARIDLSVAGGAGGALHLRAPQITGVTAAGNPIPTLVNSVAGGTDLAIKPLQGTIANPSSVIVEGFQVFDLTAQGGIIDQTAQSNVDANGQSFMGVGGTDHTAAITGRLLGGTPNSGLGARLHVRPGEELVTRSGDLTLQNGNDWNFNSFRYGPNADNSGIFGSGEPGILTLRAAGNLVLNASLTDGFTPTTVLQDPNSAVDERTQRWDDVLLPAGAQSWSYRLVAGADLRAADFHQVVPLATLAATSGSLQLGVPGTVTQNNQTSSNDLLIQFFQVIRTGTGDIDIAAARDVQLRNPFASIYTAGTQITPVAGSTLNPGGAVQLAANIPIMFANAPSGDFVTATTNGFITYRPSAVPNFIDFNCFCIAPFSVPTLPAGTVFTFPSGFFVPLSDSSFLTPTSSQTRLVASNQTVLNLSGSSSIAGIPAGLDVNAAIAGVPGVIPSSSGTYIDNAVTGHFSANTPLPPMVGVATLRFDHDATLTFTQGSGGGKVSLPAGTFVINGTVNFSTLPAGSTLTPLGTGGGLFQDYGNFNGLSAYTPTVSVVATVPVVAGTPTPLLPGFNSIVLSGNGTLSLSASSTAATYTQPAQSPNSTSYAFDTPIVGGAPGGIFSAPLPGFYYPAQYSSGGGNVTIKAGADIIHTTAPSLELPGNWLYRRSTVAGGQFVPGFFGDTASTTWWIDFSNFTQGVGALGGGNVTLTAGRDVTNVDAVVPTNAWMPYSTTTVTANGTGVVDTLAAHQPLFEYGGGNLTVTAGRNVDGGAYYVEKGKGTLTAGNSITTNAANQFSFNNDPNGWLPTTLFLGKGSFDLSARGDILLGAVANPFLLPQGILNGTWDRSYFSTYAASDSVNLSALTGSITIKDATLASWLGGNSNNAALTWLALTEQATIQGFGTGYAGMAGFMPPALRATAFSSNIAIAGALTLAPSPVGTVDFEAAGSIGAFQKSDSFSTIFQPGMINLSDANPAAIPSISSPLSIIYGDLETNAPLQSPDTSAFGSLVTETGATQGIAARSSVQRPLHDQTPLHGNDPDPVRLYAGTGDISSIELFSAKRGQIIAGHDIANDAFYLQNISPADVSSVVAGRDIVLSRTGSAWPGDISIGGPGVLDVFAGRNLNTGNAVIPSQVSATGIGVGIVSIGNGRDPFLPFDQGATITAGAGIGALSGPGVSATSPNVAGFVSAFLDPASAGTEPTRYLPVLGAQLGLSGASNQQVWNAFQNLPASQQSGLALDLFYLVLRDAGRDHNDPSTPNGSRNYEAGFRAVATMFPGNGRAGDISLSAREIKTAQGGDINLLAPGGQLLVGLDLGDKQPLDQGLLTLEGGNISIFAKNDVTVGTSRIFTFKGGNEIIWSTTGNIAAGSASKTLISAPPARFLIDPQSGASLLDRGGLATGGGIGVLQTLAGVKPGNVDLIAPNGFIDAGDAGIRVSGNLNIAALFVLNASNIQVQGTTTGIPQAVGPNIASLTAASNAAGSAANAATEAAGQSRNRRTSQDLPSIITVEVIGYGGGDGTQHPDLPSDNERRKNLGKQSYNQSQDPRSPVQVIGVGELTETQAWELAAEKRKLVGR